jgi:L-ascorbate metabolism protein UlaG (beta-lactamase superfamily)
MSNNSSHFQATYLGGPTVILEIGGLRLMTDPTLDPAGTKFVLNERSTQEKFEGPAVLPEQPIDIVLLSHDQHFDNLDGSGRAFLKEAKLTITTKVGAGRLKETGVNSAGLAPREHYSYVAPNGDRIKITATPARHGPAGITRLTGEVIGFHIAVTGSQVFDLYITGDTVYYNEIEKLGELIDPRYLFVFAGAARPRGPFNLTMGNNDVIDTAHAFPNATLIPLHSEGWSHYTENNNSLLEAFDTLGIKDRLQILAPGVATPLPVD